jgi:hypothetical protein
VSATRAARSSLGPWLGHRIDFWRTLRRTRKIARTAPVRRGRNPLPAPLIVSLTSFPPRFGVLHLTLESLLDQSVRPDRIILWIAEQDLPLLPGRVRSLEKRGITIRGCPDIGSYKKLIFALRENPDAFIVTADDDTYYEPRWLEELVSAAEPSEKVIVCHRAHRIKVDGSGKIAAYGEWGVNVLDAAARRPSTDLVPTGCGGVLYPPGSLSPEVLDVERFRRLCPTADDLWFYWMGRKAGSKVVKTGSRFSMIEWPLRDARALCETNAAGGNDRQVRNLEAEFGNPVSFGARRKGASAGSREEGS